MKNCCEEAGVSSLQRPKRRLLHYLLYATLAAALGFVFWRQWPA